MNGQLTLNVGKRDGPSFGSFFVTPENRELLSVLEQQLCGQAQAEFNQLFIWGETQAGKSHLLQACCKQIYQTRKTAVYLPLGMLAQHGLQVLEGLEPHNLLAIDELDVVMGQPEWEEALFHLLNLCRGRRQAVLLAARENPRNLPCQLPDLASRLPWGPVYRVYPLSEEQSFRALQWRARQRGFELSDKVAAYILKHCPRDMNFLVALLDRLDRESLVNQRRMTREFVREIIQGFSSS